MKKEYRSSVCEVRASEEEGIIEGYVAVWNTVDSYNSTFQRGCFTKTIQERGARIKLLWNHKEEVIGKLLELREDDHGLFVRAKLTLTVQRGRETFELIKDAAIDTFSFGFRTIKDKWVGAVRHITEVALFEISPVIFEANENAAITGVRNMPTDQELRAQEYHETYANIELNRRRYMIMAALEYTLDDIFYGEAEAAMLHAKVEDCLTKFSASFLQFVSDYIAATDEQRASTFDQRKLAFRNHLKSLNKTPEQFAATTEFNIDEVRALLQGNLAEVAPAKVATLPEEVRQALAQSRAERVELLCSELRAGLSEAERDRINGLLNPPVAVAPLVDHLRVFRESLTKGEQP